MQFEDQHVRQLAPSRLRRKLSKRIRRIYKRPYELRPTRDAVEAGLARRLGELAPAQRVIIPQPELVGPVGGPLRPRPIPTAWDPVTLTLFEDVQVLGGCNFLLTGDKALHPDLYVPARDRSPIEIYGNAVMDESFERLRIPTTLRIGSIDAAVDLCDQTPYNYAHWMTEILPRLALLDQVPECRDLPLLADHGINPNQIETIRSIVGAEREILLLGQFERLHVRRLFSVSPTSYCPHQLRDFEAAQRAGFQFYFSQHALCAARDALRAAHGRYARGRGRRVYLKRTPLWTWNQRNIVNIDDLEDVIDDQGIETVNVTGMTIAQQAKVFMNAEFIVAPSGAALTNMIFAPPGCRIVVLSAWYEGASYDYFHHMAHALGHDLSYIVGPQVEQDGHHENRDYRIDPADLKSVLDTALAGVGPGRSRRVGD